MIYWPNHKVYVGHGSSQGLAILLYPEKRRGIEREVHYTANYFQAEQPYTGKTPAGIGLGSSLLEIQEAYGEALVVDSLEAYVIGLTYCFGEKEFTLLVKRGTVSSMGSGWGKPIPDGAAYACRKSGPR